MCHCTLLESANLAARPLNGMCQTLQHCGAYPARRVSSCARVGMGSSGVLFQGFPPILAWGCEAAGSSSKGFVLKQQGRMQMPYEELQAHMHRSIFCLLPPGGTASSRRLTDIVLSGCIPVFIGPPWHAMPLARHLDYTAFAVFVNAHSMRCVARCPA